MTATESEMLERLQLIFRDVMDSDKLRITTGTTQFQVPQWDSMAQIALVMAIEQEFKVRFTAREASELLSVKAIMSLIEAKSKPQ
jgi:acyl carrier protein